MANPMDRRVRAERMMGTDMWLRPATKGEMLFNTAHKKGIFQTCYALTLNTAAPLSHQHVAQALLHLYRKVPTLRMCFRERDDSLWARFMDHEKIDFQMVEERDPVKVMEELLYYKFKSEEGPLWFGRLLPPGAGHDPLHLPDFPNIHTLILANHHGIADGTTNVTIINCFLQILDQVIAGKPVDDSMQIGEYATGQETDTLILAKQAELENDPDRFQLLMKTMKEHEEAEKLISRAFPRPRDVNYKTRLIPFTLDTDTTRKFVHKSKEEGVTIHSAFSALINGSLVDFVSDAGVKQETYLVREWHSVNCRRYWSGDTSRALGTHILAMVNETPIPASWRHNFWGVAKEIQRNIQNGLQNQHPMEFMCLLLDNIDKSMENLFNERPPADEDYGTANMGNLDKKISTEGNLVHLTNLIRSTTTWNIPVQHMFHTLRGRFLYTLCYADDVLTENMAHQLVNKIFENIKLVIE